VLNCDNACPIPSTHRRLADAHRLWHETSDGYGEPDLFRSRLNATIQELRNVTWMLQSEQAEISGFKPWYEDQQARFRADQVMRWLHEARTHVVKRGDLKTRSIARVSVRSSWDEPPVSEFEAPPLTTIEEIAEAELNKVRLPKQLRENGILAVERRWVAVTLPEHELLEALSYAYGELMKLVTEAHEKCGTRMTAITAEPHETSRSDDPSGRPPCMVATEAQRTVVLHLGTGERMKIHEAQVEYNPDLGEEAARRYGMAKPSDPLLYDPFEWAEYVSGIARTMLLKDGHHDPLVFLFTPSGMQLMAIPAIDQAAKYLLWERVATEVERTRATGIVAINEVWEGTMEAVAHGVRPTHDPNRTEGLMIVAASKDRRYRVWYTPFSRRLGRIFTRRTYSADQEHPPLFLNPVLKAWSKF
jgi:hypothetical protein